MNDTNTGGPAFPKLTQDERWKTFQSTDGMTLRDYFAAKAMATMLPTYNIPDIFADETYEEDEPTIPELIAKDAYVMADAMLKARKQ